MSNRKNPAVKRILADVRELQTHPSSRYYAAPLEDNMFEWHFTIRGPADSAFADGVYHGRILLPTDYPFKPPNIVFLTKNGRFEVGTKICLSISAYHEESWQPAWGVRTMLEAIISFMPSEGMGAIGALDWTVEERKKLAKESQSYCCSVCGKVADLLSDPALDAPSSESEKEKQALADQIAQMSMKVAAAPSSPHVGQHHSLSSDIPGAGMALRASNFAGGADMDMEIGPFSVQEGTSSYDMITTTVTAPPLEDSDGVADFLPDLSDRMSEFANNNVDAEDNFDALGMMETLPTTARVDTKNDAKNDVKKDAKKDVPDEEKVPTGGNTRAAVASSGKAESSAGCRTDDSSTNKDMSASTGESIADEPIKSESGTKQSVLHAENEMAPTTGAAAEASSLSSQSVLRNRKTHTDVTQPDSAFSDTGGGSSGHIHSHAAGCCGGHSELLTAHTVGAAPPTTHAASAASSSSSSSSSRFAIATQSTAADSSTAAMNSDAESDGLDDLEVDVDRINLAQQRLLQNLQQVPVPNGNAQLGGVRAVRADLLVDNNNNNNNDIAPNIAENRDVVDEWLSVVLIALGTTIALMAWRIVLRYYSLFLL